MAEPEAKQEQPQTLPKTMSALSLALKKDGRRRSIIASNFIVSAAQTAIVTGSRVVTKTTAKSMRRTTESVALNRNLMSAKRCHLCQKQFGHEVGKRRHCRRCGDIFCYECCSEKFHLTIYHSRWGVLKNRTSKTQYVCKTCAATLRTLQHHNDPSKAPRHGTMTEDELRAENSGLEDTDGASPQHGGGRDRSASILTRVKRTRAKTLDKYMQAVKTTIQLGDSEQGSTRRASITANGDTPNSKRLSKHRRTNTLDDGFKMRLQAKQQAQPIERSLSRAKTLRNLFFEGVSRNEREKHKDEVPFETAGTPQPSVMSALSSTDLESHDAPKVVKKVPSTLAVVKRHSSTWTDYLSSFFRFGATSPPPQPNVTDIEFDKAFELEEMALEDALRMTQEQLREYEKNLREEEKKKEKERTEQVKKMTTKLQELQSAKIKEAVEKGEVVEKQMIQHAKNLEASIKSGHVFDNTNEDDVVDLRDELRSVYLHLDELKVETVFPQCMRWKLRAKVEDGLFVGVRDLDIDKIDCNFSIKTSGLSNRVVLHMYHVQATVALYEFVIRGSSAKAKVLSRALAPTLNRVELHMTGEWYLPLIFQEGGTPDQPASRWIPEKEKAYYHLHIAKTVENAFILQLPDSFLQWLVDSLIPSLIESTVISALPTRDLGWFLTQSRNEGLIRGKLQIHGDTTPRVWKAPLVGPTHSSIAARRALVITEEEAAVLDFLLRSPLATAAGFPANKAASLSILHTWRLNFASHSLASLAPLLAVIESGSRMNIPANWTLQLLRRVDEIAAKPFNLGIQLFDVELDLDVKEMLTTITGLYLKRVEETVAKEIELENARRVKREKQRSVTSLSYSPEAAPPDDKDGPHPEEALRVAREAVARMHKSFDTTVIPLLQDQARTQFNIMLAGGSGGILAFSFTNFVADICLPSKFQFSTLVWQSPEIYEGFILKINGKNGPLEGEYSMRFNVLPAGEEVPDEEEEEEMEHNEKEEDDARTTLKNVKLELFPTGRPSGAVHLSMDAWRSSVFLTSLINAALAMASQPQMEPPNPPTEADQRHDALNEERRVRRNSHAQTELTRDLLKQSRQVVENLWGSFRLLPIVPEDDVKKDVIELAGGIDPLAMHFIPDNAGSEPDTEEIKQKILMPYLTNDAFALHIDVRGLELSLKKIKNGTGKPDTMRLSLVKSMRHEREIQCVTFSMRRNLQDVFQADLLPI